MIVIIRNLPNIIQSCNLKRCIICITHDRIYSPLNCIYDVAHETHFDRKNEPNSDVSLQENNSNDKQFLSRNNVCSCV